MAKSKEVIFEKWDNFQKQTLRNRCYIYGANGKQLLTVPIQHRSSGDRQKTRDVKIDNSFPWKKNLIKSLESSYRSSPYFEFYEDDIMALFDKKHNFLLDFNLNTIEIINECLELDYKIQYTVSYQQNEECEDYRFLANAKKMPAYDLNSYTQVFDTKHGFLSNLSILDLLFNEGTNAFSYLDDHREMVIEKY